MTLEQATKAVVAAIEAEDLGALGHALELREFALRETRVPSQDALESGNRACRALEILKQRWAAESARLHQVQGGFFEAPRQTHLVLHG